MPIANGDIKIRKSEATNNTSANGGRMVTGLYSSTRNAGFIPIVSASFRATGGNLYRKFFAHFSTAGNIKAIEPKIFVKIDAENPDYLWTIFAGTQDDTQADITGTERLYGQGALNGNESIGSTSIEVLTDGAALDYFQPSDLIYIEEGATSEYVYLTAAAVTYAGDVATLTLETGLENNYTTSAKVSSVYMPGDTQAAVSGWTETSASGTYDEVTYPIVLDGRSTIYDTWTITFSSATAFSCVGANTGSMGTGNISTNFAPNNADYGAPYFTLNKDGWGGTWATGNTVVFVTSPNAVPVWSRLDVAVGAAEASLVNYQLSTRAESDS